MLPWLPTSPCQCCSTRQEAAPCAISHPNLARSSSHFTVAGSVAFEGLAEFQGPSLLVYNDALFSEGDFESISRVGDSVKRAQAGKTGRFGIGFNSCYHLTDLPTFASGRHLVRRAGLGGAQWGDKAARRRWEAMVEGGWGSDVYG